jgi:polysaccharide pyruvyl transferase WcaK-like protein
MMGEFLAQCSVVAAREQATAERIARVLGRPIPVFGDFAMSEHWALTNGDIGAEWHVLALNVQLVSSLSTEQAEYEDALLSVVRRLMRHGLGGRVKKVCIFTTGSDGDLIPARRICDRLGNDRVDLDTPNSLDQLSRTLRRSVAVVASRLHAALLAFNEGALVVGLSPHSKIRNVFSTLGLGDYTFDLAARDQLVEQLCDTDLDTTMAIQRRAVMAAPIWDGRALARSELKALAAARGGSN